MRRCVHPRAPTVQWSVDGKRPITALMAALALLAVAPAASFAQSPTPTATAAQDDGTAADPPADASKEVKAVYTDYSRDGVIDVCDHTRDVLQETLDGDRGRLRPRLPGLPRGGQGRHPAPRQGPLRRRGGDRHRDRHGHRHRLAGRDRRPHPTTARSRPPPTTAAPRPRTARSRPPPTTARRQPRRRSAGRPHAGADASSRRPHPRRPRPRSRRPRRHALEHRRAAGPRDPGRRSRFWARWRSRSRPPQAARRDHAFREAGYRARARGRTSRTGSGSAAERHVARVGDELAQRLLIELGDERVDRAPLHGLDRGLDPLPTVHSGAPHGRRARPRRRERHARCRPAWCCGRRRRLPAAARPGRERTRPARRSGARTRRTCSGLVPRSPRGSPS